MPNSRRDNENHSKRPFFCNPRVSTYFNPGKVDVGSLKHFYRYYQ